MTELVHLDVDAATGRATVTLDSPSNRNALSAQLRRELRGHLGDLHLGVDPRRGGPLEGRLTVRHLVGGGSDGLTREPDDSEQHGHDEHDDARRAS